MLRLETVDQLIDAIRSLAVRGAPAIGLAGALGVALSAHRHRTGADGALDEAAVRADSARIASARPTAVHLARAVERVLERLPDGPEAVLREAVSMQAEDAAVNRAAVQKAADLVVALTPDRPLRILTHCNTGRLATAAVGTALGTILELAARGRVVDVLVDETRPLLQGSRLTAWELGEAGVPYRVCVDSVSYTHGGLRAGRRGPDRRQRRHRQQDRDVRSGRGGRPARHPVRRRRPRVDLGPRPARRQRHPYRAEGSGGGHHRRRRAGRTGRRGRLQPRLRRHPGRADHRRRLGPVSYTL